VQRCGSVNPPVSLSFGTGNGPISVDGRKHYGEWLLSFLPQNVSSVLNYVSEDATLPIHDKMFIKIVNKQVPQGDNNASFQILHFFNLFFFFTVFSVFLDLSDIFKTLI